MLFLWVIVVTFFFILLFVFLDELIVDMGLDHAFIGYFFVIAYFIALLYSPTGDVNGVSFGVHSYLLFIFVHVVFVLNSSLRFIYVPLIVIGVAFLVSLFYSRFSATDNGIGFRDIVYSYRFLVHLGRNYLDFVDLRNLERVSRVLEVLDADLYKKFNKILSVVPWDPYERASRFGVVEFVFVFLSGFLLVFSYLFMVGFITYNIVFVNSMFSLRRFLVVYLFPTITFFVVLSYLFVFVLRVWFRLRTSKAVVFNIPVPLYTKLLNGFYERLREVLTKEISFSIFVYDDKNQLVRMNLTLLPTKSRGIRFLDISLRDVLIVAMFFILLVHAAIMPISRMQPRYEGLKKLTINGNDELLSFVKQHNFRGDGTPENPIIIRNLGQIAQLIGIYNVDLHVIIEDSTLELSKEVGYSQDFIIENCSNIQIRNLTMLYSDCTAIYISKSKNILLEDISLYPWGCVSSDIYIYRSSSVEIRNFRHYYDNATEVGIYIVESSNIRISQSHVGALSIYYSRDVEGEYLTVNITTIETSEAVHIHDSISYLKSEFEFSENLHIFQSKNINISNFTLIRTNPLYNLYLSGHIEQVSLNNITMRGGGILFGSSISLDDFTLHSATLNSKPITIITNKNSVKQMGSAGQIIVYNSTNITISGDIGPARTALTVLYSSNITISSANITAYSRGIYSRLSSNIAISNTYISAGELSIEMSASNFTKLINCSLMGDIEISGDLVNNWNITAKGTKIYSKYLNFVVNQKNITLKGELNYTIIYNTTGISITNATLDQNIKLRLIMTSNINIDNLKTNSTSIRFINTENVTINELYAEKTKIKIEHTNNIDISNTYLDESSIGITKSDTIKIEKFYSTNSKKPLYISSSKNIGISKVKALNTSYTIYFESSNNTVISAGLFQASRNTILVYYSENVTIENITVYGIPRTFGVYLCNTKYVSIRNVALYNTTFHVVGYYYYFYGGYSARTGTSEYGVEFVWNPEYYNINIVNITVNSKPLLYGYNLTDTTIQGDYGQILLINAKNVEIKNQHIENLYYGFYILLSKNIVISNNNLENTKESLIIIGSENIRVEKNTIENASSYIFYLLGSEVEVKYNSFIGTNNSVYSLHSNVVMEYNYWSDQLHEDLDRDGINDYRYKDIDLDPLYEENSEPKPILYTLLSQTMTYYFILLAILVILIRLVIPRILSYRVIMNISLNDPF